MVMYLISCEKLMRPAVSLIGHLYRAVRAQFQSPAATWSACWSEYWDASDHWFPSYWESIYKYRYTNIQI